MTDQSVTAWFRALQDGDQNAAADLWDRYFDRVAGLARKKLVPDAAYDEEDLAASVFAALYTAAQDGRFATVANRDELWALLLVLSQRKIIDRARRSNALRRSGPSSNDGNRHPVEEIPGMEQTPDLSAAVKDECQYLLQLLESTELQNIALLKLDGHTIPKIAEQMSMGERTVSRKLLIIRKCWENELAEEN